jgi:acyl-CoA thioester hydrolase
LSNYQQNPGYAASGFVDYSTVATERLGRCAYDHHLAAVEQRSQATGPTLEAKPPLLDATADRRSNRHLLAGTVGGVPEFPDPPPTHGAFRVLWPITTRWEDNDVYGHVNNVVHYSWFDTAVNGWLIRTAGTDIRTLPAIGVVAETSCRYLSELSFPAAIEVGISLERLGNSSVTYQLAVFGNRSEQPASLGRFVHVYIDRHTRHTTPVPGEIRAAVETLRG